MSEPYINLFNKLTAKRQEYINSSCNNSDNKTHVIIILIFKNTTVYCGYNLMTRKKMYINLITYFVTFH